MIRLRAQRRRALGLAGVASILAGGFLAITGFTTPVSADPTFDETAYDAHLHGPHHGATNPGFETGDCPASPAGKPYGWHFVLPGSDTEFASLSVHFEGAGVLEDVDFVSHPTGKHAYVYTAGADTLIDAVAMTSGGDEDRFVLSHVCTPDTTTTEEEPPTTEEEPPTTEEEPPTTGEEPPTTGEEPPTTGEEPPTTGEEPTTSVLGVVVERPAPQAPAPAQAARGQQLPRTGDEELTLALAGIGLILLGGGALLFSRDVVSA